MSCSGRDVLEVENLTKYFPARSSVSAVFPDKRRAIVRAVDGISFAIREGEVLGLVGESGCGKSTAGRCALRLLKPTSGAIRFASKDITNAPERELRLLRSQMQMVFQDPDLSLNPRMKVGDAIGEPIKIHRIASGHEIQERVRGLLMMVGLGQEHADRYPHELSGGEQQRVGIARALASSPRLVVLDEPSSALDASVKISLIQLLAKIKEETGATYLLISHDLSIIKIICNEVAVMYAGRIVEKGDAGDIFGADLHPYTKALLSAVAIPDPSVRRKRIVLEGEVPDPVCILVGCPFASRCPFVTDRCTIEEPELLPVRGTHSVACHLVH